MTSSAHPGLALRLAVLFHRSRSDVRLPPFEAQCDGKRFQLGLDAAWLAASPLTAAALFWYFVVGVWPVIYLRVYL